MAAVTAAPMLLMISFRWSSARATMESDLLESAEHSIQQSALSTVADPRTRYLSEREVGVLKNVANA